MSLFLFSQALHGLVWELIPSTIRFSLWCCDQVRWILAFSSVKHDLQSSNLYSLQTCCFVMMCITWLSWLSLQTDPDAGQGNHRPQDADWEAAGGTPQTAGRHQNSGEGHHGIEEGNARERRDDHGQGECCMGVTTDTQTRCSVESSFCVIWYLFQESCCRLNWMQ